ncbi:MAG: LysE/ArgO family amino acid transporter [Spirochaetales bacterium]|nr:LysE/ArgO family amino acid transporter [Spirochaetales bacterium]
MEAYFTGLALGASLIIAIGAQNAFVLTQGVRRRYHRIIPLICSLCDALLIAAGVMGVGRFLSSRPLLSAVGSGGGALFLLWYGVRSFRSFLSTESLEERGDGPESLKEAVLFTLAVTWLNPHVYIDTILLLGGISSGIAGRAKTLFAVGAATASCSWFFSLSLGGRLLSPLFKNPRAWKILDLLVSLIMFAVALSLIGDLLKLIPE